MPPKGYRKNWARLMQKIYEVDPLTCPGVRGPMRVISFIGDPQDIKKILKHLGLWEVNPRPPPRTAKTQPYSPSPESIIQCSKMLLPIMAFKILQLRLWLLASLGLGCGSFSYTEQTHEAKRGPIELLGTCKPRCGTWAQVQLRDLFPSPGNFTQQNVRPPYRQTGAMKRELNGIPPE